MFSFGQPKRIYLDYAAATPVRPEVLSVMKPYFSKKFANPSAIHAEGVMARQSVEDARLKTARILGVRPEGVTWTASGTEANNLAIYGTVRHLTEEQNKNITDIEIISTSLEHPSITEVLNHLAQQGVKIHTVTVDEGGRINREELSDLLSERTALLTFAYVNSEIGVVQDVKAITRIVKRYNEAKQCNVQVHLDAAQAPLWLSCRLEQLGVDMLSLDAGKCYGPKGVGVLAHKHGVELKGFVLGGGQEKGLRSGTENTPLIVGAAEAFKIAQENFEARSEKIARLRDYTIELLTAIEGVELNGSREHRVANNVNVSVKGVESEFAAVTLDVAGIACSTKSACGSLKSAGSSVVRAITNNDERALTSLRFSLGEATSRYDIERLATELKTHISHVRSFNNTTS